MGNTLCVAALIAYLLVPIIREPVRIPVPQDSVFTRAEIWPNWLVRPGTFKLIISWQVGSRKHQRKADRFLCNRYRRM